MSIDQAISRSIAGLNDAQKRELHQVAVDSLLSQGIGVATAAVASVGREPVDLGSAVTYEILREPGLNQITNNAKDVVLRIRSRSLDYQVLLSINTDDLQRLLDEPRT